MGLELIRWRGRGASTALGHPALLSPVLLTTLSDGRFQNHLRDGVIKQRLWKVEVRTQAPEMGSGRVRTQIQAWLQSSRDWASLVAQW